MCVLIIRSTFIQDCCTHAVGGVGRLYLAPVIPVNQYVISLPLPCGSGTHGLRHTQELKVVTYCLWSYI